jgi:hypothetical protein
MSKLKLQDNQSGYLWDDEGNFELYLAPGQSMEEYIADLREAADQLEQGSFEVDS